MNPPARIFARNIKHPMARRCATMKIMQQCLRGNSRATANGQNCIASRYTLRSCIWRREVIDDKSNCRAGASPADPKNGNPCGCPTLHSLMNFLLRIWRQKNRQTPGKLVDYQVRDISPNTSFLEMLDILNEQLLDRGEEPIAFDFRESLAPCIVAAAPSGTRKSRSENGKRDGCRRIRQLHKYLRMRSSLSSRDQRQFHRETESRVRARRVKTQRRRITAFENL